MTTVYVTQPGSHLQIANQKLLVSHQQKLCCKQPINRVTQIVLFGSSHISREVASLTVFRHIPIIILDNNGEYLGCYEHPSKRLPKKLKRHFDPEFIFTTAEAMLRAKLHNSHRVLQQLTTQSSSTVTPSVLKLLSLQTALDMIPLLIDDLSMASCIADLREYEIMAATLYYPALGSLLPKEFGFEQRKNHPPTDPINTLINLGYTLLGQTIYSTMQQFRLHTEFNQLDHFCSNYSHLPNAFITELHPILVDELVAELAILQRLTPQDFARKDTSSGSYLTPKALKIFLKHWEKKLATEIIHPYMGKVTYRRCVELQVQEYVTCLRGDVEFYRPMLLSANIPTSLTGSTDTQKTEQATPVM
ncbi:MAG: CRISPR-associated endonuclease Cas1 [Coleofasciculaceae cyanobacterium]